MADDNAAAGAPANVADAAARNRLHLTPIFDGRSPWKVTEGKGPISFSQCYVRLCLLVASLTREAFKIVGHLLAMQAGPIDP
jgi:hypothetical protein